MNQQLTTSSLILILTAASALGQGCNDAPTLLDDAELGVRESSIINGSQENGYPAVGALHSGNQAACTATLVGKRTVLTAAHCVTTKTPPYTLLQPVNFYVGGFYGGTKYSAVAVAVHPNYAGGNKSDVAVVRLSKDVVGVTPKQIASTAPSVGENVILIGYGKTGENSGTFGTKRRANNSIGLVESQIYRLYGAGGTTGNVCDGDSGGPTFTSRGGQEVLIGVHSTKGGVCGQEGNDMRVDVFYAWIVQQAQGDLYNGSPLDKTPPQVQILKPFPYATISPNVGVQIAANDDVGVTKVLLFVNGKQIAQDTQSPFAFTLQGLAPGNATIEAVAYDKVGHTASAVATVTVDGATAPQNPQPGMFGASCSSGAQCQSKLCVNDASGLFCSQACSGPANCPGGYDCLEGVCRSKVGGAPQDPSAPQQPMPGTFGASCNNHNECNSQLCALDNVSGRRFCTALCDLTQNNCPASAICHPAGTQAVCGLPADNGLQQDGQLEGGCSLAGSGAGSASPLALLLGLVLLGLLRRRAQ